MSSAARRIGAFMIVCLAFATSTIGVASAKPIPVELWRVGDDGLTLRLGDALESAFKSSPDFTLSSGKKPGTLVVTIPTNVDWKQIGGRTQVLYTVEFSSAENQNVGASRGSCWDDEMAKCAAQIVSDAKTAAGKIHVPTGENCCAPYTGPHPVAENISGGAHNTLNSPREVRGLHTKPCGSAPAPEPNSDSAPAKMLALSPEKAVGNLCGPVPSPIYPKEARDQKIQGMVVLRVVIDRQGKVKTLAVISGHQLLVDAAKEAAQRWTFKPYLVDGKAVEVETQLTVNFSLSGG